MKCDNNLTAAINKYRDHISLNIVDISLAHDARKKRD